MSSYRVISNDAGPWQEFFLSPFFGIERTSSLAQEVRLFLELLFIGVTLSAQLLAFIVLVLPTSHLFDHQRPR